MKRLAFVMLVLAASLWAADYSGIWNGNGAIRSTKYPNGVPQTVQMTLLQDGSSLAGTFKVGSMAPMKISSGSVTGTQVAFAIQGTNGQITASLAANGSQLSGTMTLTDGEIYDVVFTKQ